MALSVLAAWALPVAAAPTPDPIPAKSIKAPYFGDVAFRLYQLDDASALAALTTSQQFHRLGLRDEEVDALRASMLLAYGQHRDAGEAFAKLSERATSAQARDRAWVNLAKVRFQRGQVDLAEDALSRVQRVVAAPLDEERGLLQAQLLMARADYRGAVRVLIALLDKTPSRFARYNLGVAQIKAGQVAEGTATLDALGNEAADTDENRALRDRTNVALGFAALKSRDAAAARRYLERVPLEGADSSKALLGYGWAAMEQQAPQSALVPWLALSKREATDPAALEARIAVPYAYSQLRANGKAIQLYLDAIQTFEQERQNLDTAIDFVRSGRWLEALSAIKTGQDDGAGWQLDSLPDVPHVAYLKGVLAQNAFREGYKNLRDLRGLSHNLQSRQDQAYQLEQALVSKRMTFDQYAKRVNAQAGASKVAALRQQVEVLTADLAQSEARMDGLAFASPHQRDMLDTIGRLQAMTNKSGAAPEIAKAKDRVRMLAGLLRWQIFQDEPTRVWKLKSALTDAREALAQADKRNAGIAQFLRDEPNRLDQFDGRVQAVSQTVQTLMPKVEALASEQQLVLQNMAVADLFAQKDNLATYLVQARFAVAQLYDQATAASKSKNGVTPHSADNQDANNAPKP